jgi:cytochrome bd-type quinol oxidase subunit 2
MYSELFFPCSLTTTNPEEGGRMSSGMKILISAVVILVGFLVSCLVLILLGLDIEFLNSKKDINYANLANCLYLVWVGQTMAHVFLFERKKTQIENRVALNIFASAITALVGGLGIYLFPYVRSIVLLTFWSTTGDAEKFIFVLLFLLTGFVSIVVMKRADHS